MNQFNKDKIIENDLKDNFTFDDDLPPHIPAGEYEATCVSRSKEFVTYFGDSEQKKFGLKFRIIDSAGEDTILLRYYNVPADGRYTKRYAYAKEWMIANDHQPPKRGDRLSHTIFTRKVFKVLVRDATDAKQSYTYSVIAGIKCVVRAVNLSTEHSLPLT